MDSSFNKHHTAHNYKVTLAKRLTNQSKVNIGQTVCLNVCQMLKCKTYLSDAYHTCTNTVSDLPLGQLDLGPGTEIKGAQNHERKKGKERTKEQRTEIFKIFIIFDKFRQGFCIQTDTELATSFAPGPHRVPKYHFSKKWAPGRHAMRHAPVARINFDTRVPEFYCLAKSPGKCKSGTAQTFVKCF